MSYVRGVVIHDDDWSDSMRTYRLLPSGRVLLLVGLLRSLMVRLVLLRIWLVVGCGRR